MPAAHSRLRASPARRTEGEVAAAGLKTFFLIAVAWHLSADEAQILLGRPARATFYRWKRGQIGALSVDTMERLSHVIGIYQHLHTLFTDANFADAWVRRPNTAFLFGGHSALERMLAGGVSDLYAVRQYLAAEAAGVGAA